MNSLAETTQVAELDVLDAFREDVLEGLTAPTKSLPCKYFYDRRGSELFDRICEQPEYYLTRTELAIMRQYAPHMAELIGPRCLLVEPGSGSSLKTRTLLAHLHDPVAYVPVDISEEHLSRSARSLASGFPRLPILPIAADFSADFPLPVPPRPERRRVVYFPGSTIGNFAPDEAVALLQHMASLVGAEGGVPCGLLIGVDPVKQRPVLEAAYNDAAGVTRAFNLNLLRRIDRELDADISVDQFEHRAFFNPEHSRIEMHLVSRIAQCIVVDGEAIAFRAGETIHTENSYKYDDTTFVAIAADAGWHRVEVWRDPASLFSVWYLTR